MPRPPVKKTEKLALAQRKGELRAEAYMHKHKSLMESAREHIGKIIDNLTVEQIAELISAAGLSILVHDVIISTKDLLDRALRVVMAPKTLFEQASSGNLGGVLNVYLQAIHDWIPFFPNLQLPAGQTSNPGTIDYATEITIWLISFAIAYLLVKHAGDILGTLNNGLIGMVSLLLPAAA